MSDIFKSLVRHAASSIGGYAVAHGVYAAGASPAEIVVGLLLYGIAQYKSLKNL